MSKRKPRQQPQVDSVRLDLQRLRLFEALGIIEVSRHALASKLTTLDEDSVIDALKVAYRIIDEVAGALEAANPQSPPTST